MSGNDSDGHGGSASLPQKLVLFVTSDEYGLIRKVLKEYVEDIDPCKNPFARPKRYYFLLQLLEESIGYRGVPYRTGDKPYCALTMPGYMLEIILDALERSTGFHFSYTLTGTYAFLDRSKGAPTPKRRKGYFRHSLPSLTAKTVMDNGLFPVGGHGMNYVIEKYEGSLASAA